MEKTINTNIPYETNIIIRGPWNHAIFTPDWLAENVSYFKEKGAPNFRIQLFPLQFQFELNSVKVIIIQDGLIISINDSDDCSAIQSIAEDIVRKLPETPVLAIGHNFNYKVVDRSDFFQNISSDSLLNNTVKDSFSLDEEPMSCSSNLEYSFKLEGKNFLLKVALAATEGEEKQIKFNFHYEVGKDKDKKVSTIGECLGNQSYANELIEKMAGE